MCAALHLHPDTRNGSESATRTGAKARWVARELSSPSKLRRFSPSMGRDDRDFIARGPCSEQNEPPAQRRATSPRVGRADRLRLGLPTETFLSVLATWEGVPQRPRNQWFRLVATTADHWFVADHEAKSARRIHSLPSRREHRAARPLCSSWRLVFGRDGSGVSKSRQERQLFRGLYQRTRVKRDRFAEQVRGRPPSIVRPRHAVQLSWRGLRRARAPTHPKRYRM